MNDQNQPFKIAKPCPATWAGMSGDDRKRFCAQCKLHVHNLSEMERHEAEQLLQESSGRLCVSYHCDEQKRPLFRSDLQALAATAASAALLLSACAPRTTGKPMPQAGSSQPAMPTASSGTPGTRLTGDVGSPPQTLAPVAPEPRMMGEVCPPTPVRVPAQQMMGKIACPPSVVKKP